MIHIDKKIKIYLGGIAVVLVLFLLRVILAFEHYSIGGILLLFVGVIFVSHFVFVLSILIVQWQRKIYTKYWLGYQLVGQYFGFSIFTILGLVLYIGKLQEKSDGYVWMISIVMLLTGAYYERVMEKGKIIPSHLDNESIEDKYEKNLYTGKRGSIDDD